ncbi:hypothetical protein WA1_24725 [Scytonema hofmannii PCC 7110]|uniref:Uncharacterized protein n=1 Tax=Scytonema hofmannii PCC 7110 TaxID=128403 RepID=A0A139X818_9CYAN|nr:hypothetical protein WA1_24725 [Scytonema hofmannii PCC 7110]
MESARAARKLSSVNPSETSATCYVESQTTAIINLKHSEMWYWRTENTCTKAGTSKVYNANILLKNV